MNQQSPQWPQQPQQQLYRQPPQWSPTNPQYLTCKSRSIIIMCITIFATLVVSILVIVSINKSSQPSDAKVGDTITVQNISCTLISVSTDVAPGYVTIQIKLVNSSQSEYHYFATDLVLKTSSGDIIDPSESGNGALAPGGHGTGTLNFQIDNPHGATLFWQPVDLGMTNDLTHPWNLGL